MLIVVLVALAWWAIGCGGFAFWWTTQFDLHTSHAVFGAFMGIFGPLTWLFGWHVHGGHGQSPPRVLMRRRSR